MSAGRILSLLFLLPLALAGRSASAAPDDPAPAVLAADEIAKAHAALAAGRNQDAVAQLEAHPATKARNREACALYGLALARVGRLREAEAIAGRFRNNPGRHPDVHRLMAEVNATKGEWARAAASFKLAKQYGADEIEVEFNVVRCEAAAAPDDAKLAALEAFKDRKEKLPPGLFELAVGEASYKLAERHLAFGRRDDATAALLERAAGSQPPRFEALELLGVLRLERGETTEALAVAARIEKEFDSKVERALLLRAQVAEKNGDTEGAYKLATDAANLSNRRLIPALVIVARSAMALGRLDDARRPLDDALVVDSTDPDANLLMARYLRVRLGEQTNPNDRMALLQQLEKHTRTAINRRPTEIETFEILEETYVLWGKPKENELNLVRQDLARLRAAEAAAAAEAAKAPAEKK